MVRNLGGVTRRGTAGRNAEILGNIEAGDLFAGDTALGGKCHTGRVVEDRQKALQQNSEYREP